MSLINETFSSLGMLWRALKPWSVRWSRRIALGTGIVALVMMVLACTRVPFDAHRWLGQGPGRCEGEVEAILILGGSGMPSGPELLRLHRAAVLALELPHTALFVVHPGDPAHIRLMHDELLLRGVAPERITLINEGNNTREQALACLQRCSSTKPVVAIVTAPENVYRSVLTFRKAGFDRGVCGDAAWDHAMDHGFNYRHEGIGGKAWLPDVSESTGMRYTFWNYLKLEITCLREYLAIAYYQLNGWI